MDKCKKCSCTIGENEACSCDANTCSKCCGCGEDCGCGCKEEKCCGNCS